MSGSGCRQAPRFVRHIGLYLERRNQGFSLHADVLRFAADRNIDIGFDIYTGPDC